MNDRTRSTRGERESSRGERGGRDRDDSRSNERSTRGRDDDRGGRRSGGYTYQRRDDDAVKKRAESGGNQFDNYLADAVKTFKANDKDNTIRILPPTWDNPTHFGLDIWVHYGVGPDRQTYLCLHKMKGEPCPVCEEHAKAVRDGDEEYAYQTRPTRRVLVYLIDRDNEKEGVMAWAMPQSLDTTIVQVSVDKRSGDVLPIDHPEEGYDVSFTKTGAKERTKYEGVQIARRDSDLGDEAWLDFAVEHPLPDMLQYFSYDHIAAEFNGAGPQRSSRDRDNERESHKSRDRDDTRNERGTRDRDDSRGERGGRDRDSERESSRSREPELTWESVHGMTGDELDALIEAKELQINPNDASTDEELADWICEDLDIKQAPVSNRQRLARR